MPVERVFEKKVVEKSGRAEAGIGRAEWNKRNAAKLKATKDEKLARAEAVRARQAAVLLAEAAALGEKDIDCKDLDGYSTDQEVSRVVAKHLGIPNEPERAPEEIVVIALKKVPEVEAIDGISAKAQLLQIANHLAEKKEAKQAAEREKKAKKQAEFDAKRLAGEAKAEAKRLAGEAKAEAKRKKQEEKEEKERAAAGGDGTANELGMDRKMVSDMRGADVVMMKTNKKKKKRAKGDTSRDVTGVLRSKPYVRDVEIDKYSMNTGADLINESSFELLQGCRYGLIGENASDKTNFLQCVASREVPVPAHIDMYLLAEEAKPTDRTAVEALADHVRAEATRLDDLADEIAFDDGIDDERLEALGDRIEEFDPTNFEEQARAILTGLGFSALGMPMDRKTKHMSPAWRMRVSLGQALFAAPSILLLDEPTNHLDLEACIWLEGHLAGYKKCLLVVSHAADFLNAVCNKIVYLSPESRLLSTHSGNYEAFKGSEQGGEAGARACAAALTACETTDVETLKAFVARHSADKAQGTSLCERRLAAIS